MTAQVWYITGSSYRTADILELIHQVLCTLFGHFGFLLLAAIVAHCQAHLGLCTGTRSGVHQLQHVLVSARLFSAAAFISPQLRTHQNGITVPEFCFQQRGQSFLSPRMSSMTLHMQWQALVGLSVLSLVRPIRSYLIIHTVHHTGYIVKSYPILSYPCTSMRQTFSITLHTLSRCKPHPIQPYPVGAILFNPSTSNNPAQSKPIWNVWVRQ